MTYFNMLMELSHLLKKITNKQYWFSAIFFIVGTGHIKKKKDRWESVKSRPPTKSLMEYAITISYRTGALYG